MTRSYKTLTVADIKAMTKSQCEIKDENRVMEIINQLISGGSKKLQLLSDFDYTITKQCMDNGISPPSSFKVFTKCKSVPSDFLAEEIRLRDVYRPIEIDPTISQEEKAEKMCEWWQKSANLFRSLTEINFTKILLQQDSFLKRN